MSNTSPAIFSWVAALRSSISQKSNWRRTHGPCSHPLACRHLFKLRRRDLVPEPDVGDAVAEKQFPPEVAQLIPITTPGLADGLTRTVSAVPA